MRTKKDLFIYNYDKLQEKAILQLQSFAGSMVFDGKIDDDEINYLNQWLYKHGPYLTTYPLSDLKTLFDEILEDGIVTEDEREKLFVFLNNIADGVEGDLTVEGVFTEDPQIIFQNKHYCFTGDMLFGTREQAQEVVVKKGGKCQKGTTLKLNYLVIGSLGSEFYKYGRFGNKLKLAIRYNTEKNTNIIILREKDFVHSIRSAPGATYDARE